MLKPPSNGVRLDGIKLSPGIIAVSYSYLTSSTVKDGLNWVILVDSQTGETRRSLQYVNDYHKFGAGLVCYQNNVFTFLSVAEDGHLQLVKAH